MRFRHSIFCVIAMAVAACGGNGDQGSAANTAKEAAATSDGAVVDASLAKEQEVEEQLDALFETYFEGALELNPVFATYIGDNRYNDVLLNNISPSYLARAEAFEKKYLEAVDAIDPSVLTGQALLSYQIFKRDREEAIEAFKFPGQLIPINQFRSTPNFFAQLGSGKSLQPFITVKDYQDFLGRIDGFVVWVDQARVNMDEGIELGIVQPRILMEKVIPQLESQIVDEPTESIFYTPVKNMPESFSDEDRAELTAAYTTAIETQLVPSYQALRDYIRDEYLPNTRETVGLGALPGGEEWYAFMVKQTTTTDFTPEFIHDLGLSEVERIHGEMDAVMAEVGFDGTLDEFFEYLNTDSQFYFDEREQLIEGYRALREDVHGKALALFERLPSADYEIRAVEPFREKSASGGSYQGASPDGSRPGVFYVNAYDLSARPKWAMESLFLHEAVPGHHFQGALNLELEGIPRFRQFGGYTAYGEGWGLYAESLGKEMGVYADPYQYFGALNAELWRAIRLVVDTGLHAKGWTRQEVLDFMYANSAVNEARAVSEAERYIAIPSQALAYKVGQLKIAELRAKAEQALGDRFDIKAFHVQILEDGELPLSVLEAKIDNWIVSQD